MTQSSIPPLQHQDVGGALLPYLHYPGGDTKLFFAHATGFLPWLWHPIIDGFSPAFSVWAPYICSYRSCNPDEGGLSWDVIAHDLGTFCRAQGIDSPVLIGHSMGATVSTLAAAAYGVTPRAMVLIEPIFLPDAFYEINLRVEDHPLASKSIKRLNHWDSEQDALSYLKSRSFFAGWDEEMLNLYMHYGMERRPEGDMQLTCTPSDEAAMFMGGASRSPWPLLEKINCPVLVVEGEKSPNVGLVDIQRAVSLLPQGQYASVPDAGHLIPMEKPSQITQLIDSFLRAHL